MDFLSGRRWPCPTSRLFDTSEAIRSLSTLALIVVVLVAGGTRRAGRRQRGEGGGWSGTIRETRVHPAQGCTYRGLEGASLKRGSSPERDPLMLLVCMYVHLR